MADWGDDENRVVCLWGFFGVWECVGGCLAYVYVVVVGRFWSLLGVFLEVGLCGWSLFDVCRWLFAVFFGGLFRGSTV